MIKKVVFLCIVFISLLSILNYAKYIEQKEILVAKIDIDMNIPKIELMNIKNTMYKETNKIFYNVSIQIKIRESNIKSNNLDKIKVKIDEEETKNYEINQIEKILNELIYEIKITKLLKNQKIQILIPESTIIDKANNASKEEIINYEVN